MKRSALCLAILCALSHPSAWAETQELWAYGVSKDGGWYDTTKTWTNDTNLCWAATAANMISWWQHWDNNNNYDAPQGALNIYDKLKEDYGANLVDAGAGVGLYWWYSGKNISAQLKSGFASKSFAGYYGGLTSSLDMRLYCSENEGVDGYALPLTYSEVCKYLLTDVFNSNRSTTVGLGLDDGSENGHSITLWGIQYDDVSGDVSKFYVTDSDDSSRGLFELKCQKNNDKLCLSGVGAYEKGTYFVNYFYTLGLISSNNAAGEDPLSGYASNSYVVKNGVITSVTTGYAPSVDDSGNVTYSGDATYSSLTSGLNLHAGSTESYKEINNVNFGSQKISLSNVILEAQGNVTANFASLVVKNATLIGNNISLGSGTEVKMTNAWIETTGTEKGGAKNATFQGTGTIKNMKITGGSLISGNSPGLMTLENTVLENTELVSTTLSFYLGAGKELSTLSDGHISIKLNTTLESGVVVGTQTEVSSGFLLTSSVTLPSSITLDVWNIENTSGARYFSCDGYSSGGYFSEGDYIQVIAFGDGMTYHDVLGTTFTLSDNITKSLLVLKDPNLGTNASWQKQVRTDGVYLVLSALPVYDVPEPATGVLVLTGLGLLLRRRRRG